MSNSNIPNHFKPFGDNLDILDELIGTHKKLTGDAAGRRRDTNAINRASVVLLVASWETYVENLAKNSFNFLLSEATSHEAFPPKILTSPVR